MTIEELTKQRDEALEVRDIAREASNRDLEAKRQAEAELRTAREEIERMRRGLMELRGVGYMTHEELEEAIANCDAIDAQPAPPNDNPFLGHACGTYVNTGCEEPITCGCLRCAKHCDCARPVPEAPEVEL